MKRRTFLAATSVSLAGLAGCSSDGSDDGGGSLDPDCTAVVDTADVTVCQGDDEGPVAVEASQEEWVVTTGDSTVETIEFEVSNSSEGALSSSSPAWVLKRRDGDTWSQVVADEGDEAPSIEAGASHTWSFSLAGRSSSGGEGTTNETVSIDDGVYAFVFQGTLDDGRSVGAGAAFELVTRDPQQGTGALGGV